MKNENAGQTSSDTSQRKSIASYNTRKTLTQYYDVRGYVTNHIVTSTVNINTMWVGVCHWSCVS